MVYHQDEGSKQVKQEKRNFIYPNQHESLTGSLRSAFLRYGSMNLKRATSSR